MTHSPPLIVLEGIRHRYTGADAKALDGIDLAIHSGEFVAILGPSGSGKSTLLNILGLLERPTHGRYLFDGRPTDGMRERERDGARAAEFGFVFQSANVLGDETVLVNACLGMRAQGVAADERAQLATAALAAVDLTVPVKQRARLLSGGERQRLAIARALATDPRVVLADEPTGNLDSANGDLVVKLIQDMHAAGRTIIVVTHNEEIAALASRRITIRDGRVIQDSGSAAATAPSLESGFIKRPSSAEIGEDLDDAVRGLAAKPFRALTLLIAFLLGIAGLVSSQGLSESAAAQVSQRLTAAALDGVTVTAPTEPQMWDLKDTRLDELQSAMLNVDHVRKAAWTLEAAAADVHITRFNPWDPEPRAPLSLTAASPELFDITGAKVTPAHAPQLLATPAAAPSAILTVRAAEELGIPTSLPSPGLSIWINNRRVQIVGIVEFPPDGDIPSPYSNTVVASRSLFATIPIGAIRLTLEGRTDPGYPAVVAPALPLALAPDRPASVQVRTVADIIGLRVGVADDLSRYVLVLAAVVLCLGCLAGAIAMYLSVIARTAEIALRRALGMSRSTIFRIFLLEALLVGLFGGAIGAVAGQVVTLGFAAALDWTPVLPGTAGPVGIAAGTICGLIAGVYPAIAAARRSPAQAIRD